MTWNEMHILQESDAKIIHSPKAILSFFPCMIEQFLYSEV